jgi:hypothetical protein
MCEGLDLYNHVCRLLILLYSLRRSTGEEKVTPDLLQLNQQKNSRRQWGEQRVSRRETVPPLYRHSLWSPLTNAVELVVQSLKWKNDGRVRGVPEERLGMMHANALCSSSDVCAIEVIAPPNKRMCCRIWKLATCEPFGAAVRLATGWGGIAGGGIAVISVLP